MLCMNGYNRKEGVLLRLPTVLRFYGSTVLRFYGSTVLRLYGSTALRLSASVTCKGLLVLRVAFGKQYQSIGLVSNTWAELDLNQRRN